MSRWKNVCTIDDEGVKTIKREPVDAAAHLEVLELEHREGRIDTAAYAKKKAEIEKGFAESKEADKKAEAARILAQTKEREAVIKIQADRKKAARAASAARSAEKAKRKGGK